MTRERVAAEQVEALGRGGQQLEIYPGREISLGALAVTRLLPVKGKRLIGPWCFLDRYGPFTFTDRRPMDVASHPHIGLQTVTWLLEGEVVHYDSLGNESLLRPGGVNVMTSGGGIAHAEQTPTINSGRLNGVQLWVALPDAVRHEPARFQHVDQAPVAEPGGGLVQAFAGTIGGVTSPAEHPSDIVGADLQVHPRGSMTLPLQPAFEHALILISGDAAVEGERLEPGVLYYLGTSRSEVALTSAAGARLLLVGGPPFPETILMWWNFVARTPEEIAAARADWEERRRFGEVAGYQGPRLTAPSLVRLARPNPAS